MTAIKPFYCALHDHHDREQHFNDYNARSIVWSRCYRETVLDTDFNKILRITSPGNICSRIQLNEFQVNEIGKRFIHFIYK